MGNHYNKTLEYYSYWTEVKVNYFDKKEIIFKKSNNRNIKQEGYPSIYNGYVYINNYNLIFSYGDKIEKYIPLIKEKINNENILQVLEDFCIGNLSICKKFYYSEEMFFDNDEAVLLGERNLIDFINFIKDANCLHNDINTDWIKDYFYQNLRSQSLWAIYKDNKIVSCTEKPDIPYLNNIIVEPGINTLQEYRKNNYAKKVLSKFIKNIINNGQTPIWSCGKNNIASEKLAKSLGFKELSEVILIT